MASRRFLYCLATAVPLAGGGGLAAQAPLARVTLGGGSATDLRGVRSGAYSLASSLTLFPDPNLSLGAGARATRFTNDEWSLGGSAAFNARAPLGPRLAFVLGANGDLVYASYHATYLEADATPALELRLGRLAFWGGGHGAAARSTFRLSVVPSVFGPARDSATARSSLGPAFGAGVDLVRFGPGEGARLAYREEHGRPDGIAVADRTVALTIARAPLELTASLGARDAAGENRAYGGGQLAVTVARGVAVFAAMESYPSNRLTGAPGGRSLSGGLSLSTGGLGAPRALPRPAGVAAPARGVTRLSIAAGAASAVEVAGDWNQWQPVALRRAENGVWYLDLAIPPGVYRYAFRIDGKSWQVPKGVAAVDDGFGGKSAWLTVSEPDRSAAQSANRKGAP
jgi:AMP-activated protein kinase-like protein